eukprot:PhM_4_TR2883/c2_g2_i2/m.44424
MNHPQKNFRRPPHTWNGVSSHERTAMLLIRGAARHHRWRTRQVQQLNGSVPLRCVVLDGHVSPHCRSAAVSNGYIMRHVDISAVLERPSSPANAYQRLAPAIAARRRSTPFDAGSLARTPNQELVQVDGTAAVRVDGKEEAPDVVVGLWVRRAHVAAQTSEFVDIQRAVAVSIKRVELHQHLLVRLGVEAVQSARVRPLVLHPRAELVQREAAATVGVHLLEHHGDVVRRVREVQPRRETRQLASVELAAVVRVEVHEDGDEVVVLVLRQVVRVPVVVDDARGVGLRRHVERGIWMWLLWGRACRRGSTCLAQMRCVAFSRTLPRALFTFHNQRI